MKLSPEPFTENQPHRVKVIRLKKADRSTLEAMADRYRVRNLTHFVEGILAALDKETDDSIEVIFRTYEK